MGLREWDRYQRQRGAVGPRAGVRRFRALGAVVAVGVVLAITAPAANASRPLTTFDGNCATAGTFSVKPTVGFVPRTGVHRYVGAGLCSGTLDNVVISAVPVTYTGSAPGVYSCGLNGDVKEPVVLTFYPGTTRARSLHAFQTLAGAGSVYVPLIEGASNGYAYGVLTVPFNSQTLAQCAPERLSSTAISINISTMTTLKG
jgi:hypothetical protein